MRRFLLLLFIFLFGCTNSQSTRKEEASKGKGKTTRVETKGPPTRKVTLKPGELVPHKGYPRKVLVFAGLDELKLSKDTKEIVSMLSSAAQGKRVMARLYHEPPKIRRDVLLAALSWSNPNARIQAALIAGKLHCRDKTVIQRLIKGLEYDPDQDVRSQTAKAFVDLKVPKAALPLISMLRHDPYDMARANAAWALGAMRYTPAVDDLVKALDDQATWVRLRAASALKRLRVKKAVKGIVEHLKKEENPLVKKRLRQALAACKGK